MTALWAPVPVPAPIPPPHASPHDDPDDTSDSDSHHLDQERSHFLRPDHGHSRSSVIFGKRNKGGPKHRQPVFCASLPEIDIGSLRIGGYRSLTNSGLDLENKMMAQVDENTAVETAPSSPPELSYSKSSKSSNSSYRSDSPSDGEATEKLAPFDDVTLQEDSERESVEDCNVKPESRPTLRRPLKRSTSGGEVRRSGMPLHTNATGRDNRYPGLQGAVSGVLRDQSLNLPHGRGLRRGFTSPSTPSLMSGLQRRDSRSPSPGKPSSPMTVGRSPQMPFAHPRSSWSGPSLSPTTTLSRQQSWQPGKKTTKQLEAEYEDGDDEVPIEAILENVPMSPMPGVQSSQYRLKTPSPHRRASQPGLGALHANLHSANVPKNAKRPVAPTIMPNGQYGAPRSPRHGRPSLPHSATVSSFQNGPFSHKHRSKSWTEDLNDEARQLSMALDEYHERLSSEKRRSGTSSVNSSPPPPSLTRSHTTINLLEMPQQQKANVMIDPLPISKEKEAVLTRTRPSWLPPKSQKEEKKHVKQWEQMMAQAAESEKKKALKQREAAENKEELQSHIARFWEEKVLPDWDMAVREPKTRELWWRGVTPSSRTVVWQKAVGNDLGLTPASFEAALNRAEELERTLMEQPADVRSKSKETAWFAAINRDVPNVFPATEVFQRGTPVHTALSNVLKAYAMYRNDVGYVYGTHLVAGVLCLHMRAGDAFVTLANLLNRPIPLAFLVHDQAAMALAYEMVLSTLKYKFTKLHSHLTSSVIDLKPHEYLDPIFRCLLAYNMQPEHVSRVWDIFVFEGDKTLVRAAVAVFGRLESKLYGTRSEILDLVSWRNERDWPIGTEDEFIQAVRDAGKADGKGEIPAL
ncbi:hypothetical protein B0A50_05114 [Salinomyces thailandicus]|uniref:Rab-GAP TBC domain-containing protein n=1 Tax=Salinomyces thailandicus TaxID=706561 RepID=A0A4U0TWW8_9PEZI|nr:hypothetical protein B0A50_05114 [Salinomyces thailandica]